MVLKRVSQAAEDTFLIGVKVLHSLKGISRKLFLEAEAFMQRNRIVDLSSLEDNEINLECCPHCLKAHLLKKADEMNLGKATREIIISMGELQTGHDGYYLDKEKIVKL